MMAHCFWSDRWAPIRRCMNYAALLVFRSIPMDSDTYENLGGGGTWVPSKASEEDPSLRGGTEVDGDVYSYMATVMKLYNVADAKKKLIGIFTSGSIPSSLLNDGTGEEGEEGEESDESQPEKLLFLTIPGHGSYKKHIPELYRRFEPTYYLVGGGQQVLMQPDFEVLKTILDVRRPLRAGPLLPNATRCDNNDAGESEFIVLLQHNQLMVGDTSQEVTSSSQDLARTSQDLAVPGADTGVEKPSEESGKNILYHLMYSCDIANMELWNSDPELQKYCEYSPACRKYGLGFVNEEPPSKPAHDTPRWGSLDIEADGYGSTSATVSFAFGSGYVIDCNNARVRPDNEYVGCETSYLYENPPLDFVRERPAPSNTSTSGKPRKGSNKNDEGNRAKKGRDNREKLKWCPLFELLDLSGCTGSLKSLEKHCRKQKFKVHPDRGGDLEMSKIVNNACDEVTEYCRRVDFKDTLGCKGDGSEKKKGSAERASPSRAFICRYFDSIGVAKCGPMVKKKCKRLWLKHHPDKGGDHDEFIRVRDACDRVKEFCEMSDADCSVASSDDAGSPSASSYPHDGSSSSQGSDASSSALPFDAPPDNSPSDVLQLEYLPPRLDI
eukprot:TRINITY_DN2012_c0_g2_i1.p2 TRINITY_DN2012_c0_g2~~TRINITY_DN2012_c0_g2_i1.p2  ORF type:complete len:610 (-),score=114.32 TRINITY_DN2012_c0_g2_i1:94-1923(-)